ncbi:tRNA dimethylallyltransferase, mitochondrial [Vermiconidia calcicola]|uniref:tRNA dimethylallyltransferase, mitochondrial n=1 Tax=Vermiconidia calcicola TaxID=1690605 RepID=A0ACC3NRP4_9PEZI|nr:tRNA dimethylallyltransferase, mitochondrial [Vermiconidia calcicola]
MARSPPSDPLIAIIGATGTGKSQLAVELAKRYNGEIVNGDAMQLYAGLPIITNKITAEEQQGIPHHLLGYIGLHEQTWVVGMFVWKALSIIEEIRSRGRLPILVGGTHYYTQSLLFRDRLPEENGEVPKTAFVKDTRQEWPMLQQATEVLLEELRRVDPIMADRWHPNDHRKIQRGLEIYLQTGRKASDIYAEQRQSLKECDTPTDANGSPAFLDGPSMRFSTLLFWVHAETDALRNRLDNRVDKMLEQGLLDEVKILNAFAESQLAKGEPVDETRGIWVSIGYKEFKAYAQALGRGGANEHQLEKVKAEALERTKISTRQYAKRQVRWIRIKLVNALFQANASHSLYLLDGSNVDSFEQDVVAPALELTHHFLTASEPLPDPNSLSAIAEELLTPRRDYDLANAPEKWVRRHCELCGVTCGTEEQWGMHVKSKAHRKLMSKKNRAEEAPAKDVKHAKGGADPATYDSPSRSEL